MRTGYVYLIGADEGPIKIGHATNVRTRLASLQIGNWRPLTILHSVTVPWTVAPTIEGLVHDQFKEQRVRGEWFAVPLGVIKPTLERVAESYVTERAKGDWFSQQVCFALCDDPLRSFKAVSAYRDTASKPGNGPYIASVNRLLLETAGQAAYVMFQTVIVEGRDISHAVHNSSRLARQAEASLIRALNILTDVWTRAEMMRRNAVDFSRKSAA